jgi:CBS domain-containing protein
MMDRVADHVRYRRLISVAPDSSVEAVCRLMTERGIGAVAVVEDCGVLAGLVSEHDIVSKVVAKGRRPGITQVRDIMRREPRTIDADQPLSTAFDVLRDADLRHLPVMRNGRPISMLSMRDVAAMRGASRRRPFAAAK